MLIAPAVFPDNGQQKESVSELATKRPTTFFHPTSLTTEDEPAAYDPPMIAMVLVLPTTT